jgi:hypothetical protein
MIWYLENLQRSRSERETLESLASSVDWLTPIGWCIDKSLRLVWDADIATPIGMRSISLRYPNHFPHSPAVVLPRGDSERWSVHQYGPGGELCLEYGPDNWHPEITGADMISSVHRLLEGERPTPDRVDAVASRHKTTIGQDLRNTFSRLLVTRNLAEAFSNIPEDIMLSVIAVGMYHGNSIIHAVSSILLPNGETWRECLPEAGKLGSENTVALFRWPTGDPLPSIKSISRLRVILAERNMVLPATIYAVILWQTHIKFFYLNEGDDSVLERSIIRPQQLGPRMDTDHSALAGRKAALIGCGSLGSKMAVSLARAGVGGFLLVDDDILLPDNLVRNDLDWREVGTHKADGVATKIHLVNPNAKVSTRKHRLGGQEASGSIETLIEGLGVCDLIIDATADPVVFNYLSAAVAISKKPLLWAEVFGGGFGGLLARHRPSVEPPPPTMRLAIETWCVEHGLPIQRATENYGGGQSTPAIADDADVAVIAAHAARMAIDLMIPRDPSLFPFSVYLIGLGKGWIFEQPFETYPIDIGKSIENPIEIIDRDVAAEELARILGLFREYKDAASSDSKGSETAPT